MSAHTGERAAVLVSGPRPDPASVAMVKTWQQRRLIPYVARRCNQKRYLRTWLGRSWLVLRPGLPLVSQLFVFAGVVKFQTGATPYAIVLLLGFAVWMLLSESAYWGARSLELNRRTLRALRVPTLLLGLGAAGPALVDTAIGLGFLAIALLVYLVSDGQFFLALGPETLLAPVGAALLLMLGMGIGLALAVPGSLARDVRFGLRVALGAWYLLTPIVYPISAVPDGLRQVVECNPATGAVGLVMHGLVGQPMPSTLSLASSAIFGVGVLAGGVWLIARLEPRALDHV
ncbi:ABC transporter permease [Svornostia abyssi]|uniref:ABC transporter permease n=1 Tax=Svornostia abyssi TaxID=2898438 RepID=A0ABY5PM38_9ACTN|nr:ABC transporter permease [Parviterribacteraceae bacterium J379]